MRRLIPYDNLFKQVSGYVRTVKNMSQIIIRGAGHIAPYDQPRRSRDMIDKLIGGTPF
jgi:vitellogenic carboxypeptidase-like protein